jgi:hypothetical protein
MEDVARDDVGGPYTRDRKPKIFVRCFYTSHKTGVRSLAANVGVHPSQASESPQDRSRTLTPFSSDDMNPDAHASQELMSPQSRSSRGIDASIGENGGRPPSTKALRVKCWAALNADDPDALLHAIQDGAERFHVSRDELVSNLDKWLWKNDEMIFLSPGVPKGLIAAAACNKLGVPAIGAVLCLKRLLSEFPRHASADVIDSAVQRCTYLEKEGLNRAQVIELLEEHARSSSSEQLT